MIKKRSSFDRKSLLILAIGFLPNIGGLETHLKDLIDELIKNKWNVKVLTYQPLNTPLRGKWIEESNSLAIFRLPVIQGIFYKLLTSPAIEFLFLAPLLFLSTPILLLRFSDIQVINAQGLIAGFSAAFWSKIFKKRYVVSAQSVYNFPKNGLFRNISSWIFNSADKVIAISAQSGHDIETLGVNSEKIQLYTNWEDGDFFKPHNKIKAKKEIGFQDKFIVSFFGRLVEEKGIKVLIEAVRKIDKKITIAIYGEGPLINYVLNSAGKNANIVYMKTISPKLLPLHYCAADLVVMPSLHQEGFGRVAAGALLCGTPVISSNRGALPEVVNDLVGRVIDPTPFEIAKTVNFYFINKKVLKKNALLARRYALKKFSSKNAQVIISAFAG